MANDHKPQTEPSEDAVERLTAEPMSGTIEYADGTVVANGKVVKRGPRVILNDQGHVIGMAPE